MYRFIYLNGVVTESFQQKTFVVDFPEVWPGYEWRLYRITTPSQATMYFDLYNSCLGMTTIIFVAVMHEYQEQCPPTNKCGSLEGSYSYANATNAVPQASLCQQQYPLVWHDLLALQKLGSTRQIQTLPGLSGLGISWCLDSPSDMPVTQKTYGFLINS